MPSGVGLFSGKAMICCDNVFREAESNVALGRFGNICPYPVDGTAHVAALALPVALMEIVLPAIIITAAKLAVFFMVPRL